VNENAEISRNAHIRPARSGVHEDNGVVRD
jgi:hypothetical protein